MNERELAKFCGITDVEYEFLVKTLGRSPTPTEIQMMGVMWSEHCSYKSSKRFLKKLKVHGPQVVEGPGENAGLVSYDDDHVLAFKIESHNHPSFVEPFQGAATGVGGILRDIFTMGARPVALGNYLRFGEFRSAKQRYLIGGVVGGIAHYGNCMGIPTVAGHIGSRPCYNGNILVNVLALGIAPKNRIYRSSTAKPGQSVLVFGAKTGRDGIHGASLLASQEFGGNEESTEQKIRVQVGDPFKEKCLMEATLEMMDALSDDLLCIQDMGAAGLTCSTLEISSKSKIGMTIQLDRVPLRESGMEAFEILLSESQERMLAIVRKGSEEKFARICEKWGVDVATIGETNDTMRVQMDFQSKRVVDLPISDLIDPPEIDLPSSKKKEIPIASQTPMDVSNEWAVLKKILSDPSIASKEVIFEQYDSTVGASTVLGPGHDVAALWLPTEKLPYGGVAFKGVSDDDYYERDSRYGAISSMARAARALTAAGAKPMAVTDGMNLGSPSNPEVVGHLEDLVEGMNEAMEAFQTPCVSGNVSMYNQSAGEDIFPTIFMVMVGILPDVRQICPSVFQRAGSEIWLIDANPTEELPFGSVYAQRFWSEDLASAGLPMLNLENEKRLQSALLFSHEGRLFLSAREVSRGGIAVSLAKACFGRSLGFDGDWSKSQQRRDSLLFSEGHGRVIVEIESSRRAELMKLGLQFKLQIRRLGSVVEAPTFCIRPLLQGDLSDLRSSWEATYREALL